MQQCITEFIETLYKTCIMRCVWCLCGQNMNRWMSSNNLWYFFLFIQKWREFRKWMPLIITLFGSCLPYFFSLLMLHRLCFFLHYLHYDFICVHITEKRRRKNTIKIVPTMWILYHCRRIGNQFSPNKTKQMKNNLQNAIYKKIIVFILFSECNQSWSSKKYVEFVWMNDD